MRQLIFIIFLAVIIFPAISLANTKNLEPRFQNFVDRASDCISNHHALRNIYRYSDAETAESLDKEASYFLIFTAKVILQEGQVKDERQALDTVLNESNKKTKILTKELLQDKGNVALILEVTDKIQKCQSEWSRQIKHMKEKID